MTEKSALEKMLKAPDYQVRAILLSLCDDSDIREKALSRFAALDVFDKPSKRKAVEDIHVCVQCDEPFTCEDNEFGDCMYHPGDLEPDYDSHVWADHDERCHGTIDSDWCRKEYPDGFAWDCCDKIGTDEGCTRGKHEAHPDKKNTGKSVRVSDEEEEDSEDYEDHYDEEEEEEEGH